LGAEGQQVQNSVLSESFFPCRLASIESGESVSTERRRKKTRRGERKVRSASYLHSAGKLFRLNPKKNYEVPRRGKVADRPFLARKKRPNSPPTRRTKTTREGGESKRVSRAAERFSGGHHGEGLPFA